MKWKYFILISTVACILICSCVLQNENNNGDEIIMDNTQNIELDGFHNMMKATLTDKNHSLNEITKILFFEDYDEQYHNSVAIDIGNRRLFIEPDIRPSMDRLQRPDYQMTETDVVEVLEILERNGVLEWNSNYGERDITIIDGGSWLLCIQYSDNTVSRFEGWDDESGMLCPDSYDSFVREIIEFTHSRKPN